VKAGFIHPDNIEFSVPREERCYLLWTKSVFDWHKCSLTKDPVAFVRENGIVIRMFSEEKGTTDFSSTPPFIWCVPGFNPTRFALPATFHDDGYKFHKVRQSVDGGLSWIITHVNQKFMDDLLEEMIRNDSDPGNVFEQWVYRAGVWLGGSANWMNKTVLMPKWVFTGA